MLHHCLGQENEKNACAKRSRELFGGNFLGLQILITAFNQVCIVLLVYFATRRYVRSYRQAMLGLLFVFVGVNALQK